MSDEPELSGADRELVEALGALRPAKRANLSAQLLYEAGRTAGRAQGRTAFRASLAAAAVLVAALGATWLSWPEPRTIGPDPLDVPRAQLATPDGRAAAPVAKHTAPSRSEELGRSLPDQAYLNMRQAVLEQGLEALPDARGGGAARTLRDWMTGTRQDP